MKILPKSRSLKFLVSAGSLSAAGLALLLPETAMAYTTLANVSTTLSGTAGTAIDIVGWLATAYGVMNGFSAVTQFREHSDNPQQVPMSKPLMRAGIAAAAIGLPAVLGVGITGLFGTSDGALNTTSNLSTMLK